MTVFVQSLPTTDEKVSKMMDQLIRRDDTLVETFLTVLEMDGQKHIKDYILRRHNTANEERSFQQQFSVQQNTLMGEVAAEAGQQFSSYDNSETEVKKLIADQDCTDHVCSAGNARNATACRANLLYSDVDMDCCCDDGETEVKKLVADQAVTVHGCSGGNARNAKFAGQANLLVGMDCSFAHDSGTLVSETACKVAESSAQPVAEAIEVVDCVQEVITCVRPEATGLEVDGEGIELREYQRELAKPGVEGHNLIICAPTGSGKTFTAGYICRERRLQAQSEQRRFKAAFIVCIRNLITQQSDALRHIIGDDIVRGADDKLSLSILLGSSDIIVATAQVVTMDFCYVVVCFLLVLLNFLDLLQSFSP